jgi:hypothetical protein
MPQQENTVGNEVSKLQLAINSCMTMSSGAELQPEQSESNWKPVMTQL